MKNATIFYNTKYECRYYKEDVILPDDNVTNDEIEYIRNEYEKKLENKNILINELLKRIKELTTELSDYKVKHTV